MFYFIVDVDEYVSSQVCHFPEFILARRNARRIWFWRYFPLMCTTFCCMFCGGILIEVIQAALPVNFEFIVIISTSDSFCSLKGLNGRMSLCVSGFECRLPADIPYIGESTRFRTRIVAQFQLGTLLSTQT